MPGAATRRVNMTADWRCARANDLGRLVELMTEFYAESGYSLQSDRAAAAFSQLLADDRLGRIWLLEVDGTSAGYVVLTLGFSMEYGGLDAFIDDLFVRSSYRGQGHGTKAVAVLRETCIALGVRALHLEADRDSLAAQHVYRKAGFEGNNRQLLTLRLAAPTHAE
jgi:GNAT superfamily N-acetyltransferase